MHSDQRNGCFCCCGHCTLIICMADVSQCAHSPILWTLTIVFMHYSHRVCLTAIKKLASRRPRCRCGASISHCFGGRPFHKLQNQAVITCSADLVPPHLLHLDFQKTERPMSIFLPSAISLGQNGCIDSPSEPEQVADGSSLKFK